MKNMMEKKGQNQYISWILILGMMVALSFFLYNWSLSQAERTAEELEARTDPLVCAELGVNVKGSCQEFNRLVLNVTNTNNLVINGFLIKTVGLYPEDDDYLIDDSLDYEIYPGETERVVILKRNTLNQVKIVPVTLKGKKKIYCEDKSVTLEQENLGQC